MWKLPLFKKRIADKPTTGMGHLVSFDITNGTLLFRSIDQYEVRAVTHGYNHMYCLPNKPIKYFVMNLLLIFKKLQDTGGLTLDIMNDVPVKNKGYTVSQEGTEKIFDIPTTISELEIIVSIYLKAHGHHTIQNLGFWINDKKLYLDIVDIFDNLAEALKEGIDRKQLAIYDLENQRDINLLPIILNKDTWYILNDTPIEYKERENNNFSFRDKFNRLYIYTYDELRKMSELKTYDKQLKQSV